MGHFLRRQRVQIKQFWSVALMAFKASRRPLLEAEGSAEPPLAKPLRAAKPHSWDTRIGKGTGTMCIYNIYNRFMII